MAEEIKSLYPEYTREMTEKKDNLTPDTMEKWRQFSRQVFSEGALDQKTKQLIAIAVAHVTQCPYCIRSHTSQALRKGATEQEILEAIWIAAEMRAGAATAHAALAIDEMKKA